MATRLMTCHYLQSTVHEVMNVAVNCVASAVADSLRCSRDGFRDSGASSPDCCFASWTALVFDSGGSPGLSCAWLFATSACATVGIPPLRSTTDEEFGVSDETPPHMRYTIVFP